MFCLSSSDIAFCLSRYSASARSLSSTFVCCFSSSLSSHVEHVLAVSSLTCRFWLDVLLHQRVGRLRRKLRIRPNRTMTSTRRLPRTGSTLTRPMNALDQRRFVRRRDRRFGASGAGAS